MSPTCPNVACGEFPTGTQNLARIAKHNPLLVNNLEYYPIL
jgi:hypothetical protein